MLWECDVIGLCYCGRKKNEVLRAKPYYIFCIIKKQILPKNEREICKKKYVNDVNKKHSSKIKHWRSYEALNKR